MSGRIQRILRFAYLSGLALSLAGLLPGAGCSKGVLEGGPALERTWTCDKAADDAMKMQDYEAAIAYQMSVADKLAEEEFLKALEIDPGHVDARLYLSLLYTDMGELQKASDHLRKILEIDPTHRRAREFLERIERE